MWTLKLSWLDWMNSMRAHGADCNGPDHCCKYGDITIKEGLQAAAGDPSFNMSWARWVFITTKAKNDRMLNEGIIALMRSTPQGERYLRLMKNLRELDLEDSSDA